MKVVSVINYKGGVGKTTLTANLGAYAASQGKRVLLIDMDPQTQLTFNFISTQDWASNFAEKKTLKSFFTNVIDREENAPPLSDFIISEHAGENNIDIISSHLDLIDTELSLAAFTSAPNIPMLAASSLKVFSLLKEGLEPLKNEYDLVLIDCPPNFYVMVKNALIASNYYLIPAKLDYLSMLGIENLQRGVNKFLGEYDNYVKISGKGKYKTVSLSCLGVVPMMVTYFKGEELINAHSSFLKELKAMRYDVLPSVRNNSTVFGVAPKIGMPIVLTKPKLFFQKSQQKIVDELKILGNEFLKKVDL